MAPPRIARPQPGGEARRICTAYRRIARRRVPSASSLRRDRQRPHRPHRLRPATRVGAPARNRQVVSARRNSPMPPCAACPGPGIEKLSIRFDDPGRLHRSGFRGPGASGNPSKCQEDRGNRRALAIRREVTDGNRPGFAAGTQGGARSGRLGRPSASESGTSETLTAARLEEISAMPIGLASLPGRGRCMFHPRRAFSSPRFAREIHDPSP